MKNKRKILIITAVTAMMALTGCTKTEESIKNVSDSAVEAEDLPAPEKPEDGEAPAKDGENPAEKGTDDEGGENADSADNSQKNADVSSLRYVPDTEGDLYGDICEIGDKQFTVTEIYMEETEGGGEVMAMVAPEAENESQKITVVYDDNTVFEKQKIWDGGANHEEKEGSAADLQKGFTAEMWGSYEGDVFHATAIRVVEVILE